MCDTTKYRLYTEVKVSTGFIKPRAEGTRFDNKYLYLLTVDNNTLIL